MRKGVAWATVGVVLTRALGFVTLLVLTHLLLPSEFGTVAAIVTFLALIQLSSDLGMQAAVVYEQEEGVSDRIHSAFTLNLLIAVGATLLGILVAPLVAAFFHVPEATDLFRLASLNLLLYGLGNIYDGLLLRELSFQRRVRPQILQGVAQAATSIALASAGLGATAMVVGSLVGTACWVACLWAMAPVRLRLTYRPDVWRSMIGYGGAAAGLEIVAAISSRADALVVGRMLGDEALGLYTLAFRLPEIVLSQVAWTISTVAFPALSRRRRHSTDELNEVSWATARLMGVLGLYAVPVGIAISLLAGPIVTTLFSDRWSAAAPVLAAVALTATMTTVIFPLGDAGKAMGRQRTLLLLNVLNVPVLVGAMVLASSHGIVGVAWAGVGATVLFVVIFLIWGRYSVGIPLLPIAREMRPGLVAGVGVAVAVGLLRVAWTGSEGLVLLIVAAPVTVLGALAGLRLLAPGTLTRLVQEFGPRRLRS
ncbi:MAG: oligosaccharide flippase family protein [Patulibacter sp.]|nr:oligosaccharide flippase family protein [Patulibacter sp.]